MRTAEAWVRMVRRAAYKHLGQGRDTVRIRLHRHDDQNTIEILTICTVHALGELCNSAMEVGEIRRSLDDHQVFEFDILPI